MLCQYQTPVDFEVVRAGGTGVEPLYQGNRAYSTIELHYSL